VRYCRDTHISIYLSIHPSIHLYIHIYSPRRDTEEELGAGGGGASTSDKEGEGSVRIYIHNNTYIYVYIYLRCPSCGVLRAKIPTRSSAQAAAVLVPLIPKGGERENIYRYTYVYIYIYTLEVPELRRPSSKDTEEELGAGGGGANTFDTEGGGV